MPSASENYWTGFAVTDKDIEGLYGYVLERGEAVTPRELSQVVIAARIKEEEERRARFNSAAVLYQPKLEFEVGQRVLFSALGDVEGVVKGIRPSDNPRLPPFQVIRVEFPEQGTAREFAAAYELPHPLNEAKPVVTGAADELPEQIYATYGAQIEKALIARLRGEKEFVELDGKWLLRGLMADVHVGLLNIAEAAIEQQNGALTTPELARILELDTEGPRRETVAFSLEYALQHDERFVDVGPLNQPRWYLARLEPPEVQVTPKVMLLRSGRIEMPLPPEIETILGELEDESDEERLPDDVAPSQVSLVLTYPHRRAGTLPLTPRMRSLFPETDKPMLITLVDAMSQARQPAWVVPDGNYIGGLKGWYDQHKLHPGAVLDLERRDEPFAATINFHPQRERSLWVRAARTSGGHLTLSTDRRPVAHKYDDEMLILIGDPAGLDALTASNYGDRPLESLLLDIFPELAKLVPGGRVHAKTLYSAVNFAKRIGPRLVFAALVQGEAFSSVGGGYFVLDTAKVMVR